MKYIYIDESGDLGDNYLGSRYFVVGAIIVDDPKNLNRIIKDARNKYRNIIGRDLEVKGNKTNRDVIKKIWARSITSTIMSWPYSLTSKIFIIYLVSITIMYCMIA